MLVNPLYYDPATGQILQTNPNDTLNVPVVSVVNYHATLLHAQSINTCCALLNQTASLVTSIGSSNPAFRPIPYVDCIILEAGIPGDSVLVAQEHGRTYNTSVPIAYLSDGPGILYLSQSGLLTTTEPLLSNGDDFKVVVGRLLNANQFIFAPEAPIDLNAGGGSGGSADLPDMTGKNGDALFTNGTTDLWRPIYQSDIKPNPGITSFNVSPITLEVGQSIAFPSFTASYNETPPSVSFSDSINNSPVTLSNINSFNSTYSFQVNTIGSVTFTLTANFSTPSISTTHINWYDRIYYGATDLFNNPTTLSNSQLSSARQSSYNVNAGSGQYIYFCFPVSFGTPLFYVGGFQGGFELTDTIAVTNSYGIVIEYNIYKSDNLSLGAITVVIQ